MSYLLKVLQDKYKNEYYNPESASHMLGVFNEQEARHFWSNNMLCHQITLSWKVKKRFYDND